MKPLARRTDALRQSDIRAVTRRINAAGGINLGQGICDLPTPPPVKEAAQQAIEDDRSIYSSYAGIEPLRRAIWEKVTTYNRIPAASPDEVMVSVGSTGAFVTALLTLLEPGDEVILFAPFYGYHRNLLDVVGATVRTLTLQPPNWDVDFDALERLITPRTKAVVVNTPGNPHGKVWTRDELQALLALLERHDLWAITDEIYEYMLYDGRPHVSLAALPGAYARTISLSGLSKTYNMTGWRLGYAVAPPPVIDKMGLLNDLFYICAPTPLQHGAAAAFALPQAYLDEMQGAYAEKRRMLCTALEQIGFDVPWPQGAYYVFASFAPLADRPGFEDAQAACDTLMQEAGVATVPGGSFFADPADGRHFLRFCFAKERPVLARACEQLNDAFG